MRVASEAVARQAGIENGDLAAGTAELQGAGETGKAAADDDDVIHGDKLRVVDGGGWAGPGAKYRPAIRARDGQRAGLRHRRESRPSLSWLAGQCRIRYRRAARGDLIWRTGCNPPVGLHAPGRTGWRICISVRTWWLSLERPLSSRDADRRGVRMAAISCGTHDAREHG